LEKKLIEKEARKYRMSLKQIKDADLLSSPGEYGLGRVEDLLAAIGYGKYSARKCWRNWLRKQRRRYPKRAHLPGIYQRGPPRLLAETTNAIIVKGYGTCGLSRQVVVTPSAANDVGL